MPFEIPYDVITDLQAITRREANLSSYNPNDVVLPQLPSLRDAVSQLDPSPDYLRCKHCNGRLLNGVHSVICVFCGTRSETRPDPIKFTSTIGYHWLLDSLQLDGSEVVEVPVEETNRGRSTHSGREIPVSQLLDLEIRFTSPKTAPGERKLGGLNLGVFDLDQLLTELKEEVPVMAEQEDGWEADFQFATSSGSPLVERHEGEGGGSGAFAGVSSAQLDSVFGSRGKTEEVVIASSSASNANENWFEGDLWSGGGGGSNAGREVANNNGTSSLDVDWIGDGQWQSNPTSKAADVKAIDEDEDAFDDWDDFTGSTSVNVPGNDDAKDGVNRVVCSGEQEAGLDLFGGVSNSQDVDFGGFSQPDFFWRGLDNQNSAAGVDALQSETSASNRMQSTSRNTRSEADDIQADASGCIRSVGEVNGEVSNGNTRSEADDIQALTSQMHDLSFMLATCLSIPQKKDPFSSFSTD